MNNLKKHLMKKILKITLISIITLALIQLIPVDYSQPPVKKSENFVDIYPTSESIKKSLKKACYDCHSYETVYPKYAKIAPISWSIKNHINEGREHLNFSIWATYNRDLKKGMLENTIADIEQNRMPIKGYIAQHPEANLSPEEKKELIDYFKDIFKKENF